MTDHLTITTPIQGSTSHMSWGSVLAGAVIATGTMFFLSELCMAVGLGVLQPQDPSHNPSATTIAVSGGIA